MLKKLDQRHKTKLGYFGFAIIEFAISYGFISLAIDRGNFWWYLLALIFLVGALQNLFKLIGTFIRESKKPRR